MLSCRVIPCRRFSSLLRLVPKQVSAPVPCSAGCCVDLLDAVLSFSSMRVHPLSSACGLTLKPDRFASTLQWRKMIAAASAPDAAVSIAWQNGMTRLAVARSQTGVCPSTLQCWLLC